MIKQILPLFALALLFACQSNTSTKPQAAPAPTSSVAPKPTASPDRFEAEIKAFEQQDQANGLLTDGVLFTGSSSIRMWKSLEEDMKGIKVLNRGFGGATIPEVLQYAERYLLTHKPQIIVFYCGENDISEGASPEQVYGRFKTFAETVREKLPNTKLLYLSMKPSLSRWNLWEKYKRGDQLIRAYIYDYPQFTYLNTAKTMLDEEGELKPDIFIEDGLHMNAKGYAGWTEHIRPVVEKLLQ